MLPHLCEAPGDREVCYAFDIKMADGAIYNPSTAQWDRVSLRSYVQTATNQPPQPWTEKKFIAPTIEMKPGQTVRITLRNELGDDVEKDKCTNHSNVPNCFNGTNLHAHGLWVSPSGNSDNVLLEIKPRTQFQYEYNVPVDHPAGTYWYHPHLHGSTAVQVASGMAGALIIRGDRQPTLTKNNEWLSPGDIDRLLEPLKATDVPEVLVFQQFPYGCFGKDQKLRQQDGTGRWICNEGDIGEIKDFGQQLGFAKWAASGRFTSINGSIFYDLKMKKGKPYRWRLIDAGIHEPIGLRITRLKDQSVNASTLLKKKWTREEEQAFLKDQCAAGDAISQFEIASDGLTRARIQERDRTMLQPGYRSDILFAFPSEGTYCLYDEAERTGPKALPQGPRLLTLVTVKGGEKMEPEDPKAFLIKKLTWAAGQKGVFDDSAVRKKVIEDLQQLKTTAFAPHKPFVTADLEQMDEDVCQEKNSRVTRNQSRMTVKESQCVTFFAGGDPHSTSVNPPVVFRINGRSFDSNEPPRTLHLGYKQKWVLGSTGGDHPFHIHVNPFQIIQILKANKTDTGKITGYTDVTDIEKAYINKEKDEAYYDYVGMAGAWKDTIVVRADYKVIVATQYRRYIGDFVFHCHLLDHEDQGMMESVRIVLSDSEGQAVPSAHANH
jgi:FtsP/CotA-like multicopper oxidase with cupredoxin domain